MPSRWVKIWKCLPEELPESPGCYVVICATDAGDRRVLYVGQSANLRRRFEAHNLQTIGGRWTSAETLRIGHTSTPWGEFKEVFVKFRPSVKYGDWAMVELRLIRRLRPQFNACPLARQARGETWKRRNRKRRATRRNWRGIA